MAPSDAPKPVSGLRTRYRIETSDGHVVEVHTAFIDMLRWEKDHAGQSWVADQSLTGALWVAWAAGKRQGLIEGNDPAGWAASVVDFEVLDQTLPESDGVALDPTQQGPSA